MMVCPTLTDLRLLLQPTLDETQRAQWESHLDGCAACRELLDQLLADDALLPALRRAVVATTPQSPASPSAVGVQITGYDILSVLHLGGQGAIYKAWQHSTKRLVALKIPLHGAQATPLQRERFAREIDLAAALNHPNIVTIYDSGATVDQPYFAMEYIEGVPLTTYAQQWQTPLRDRAALLRVVCGAVGCAHRRGIIHRDLKPSNILVDGQGRPVVLDFGLAHLQNAQPLTQSGEFVGTVAYSAPEQATGSVAAIDTRTDVYALGVLGYELCTGQLPYPTAPSLAATLQHIIATDPIRPSTVNKAIDRDLDTILLRCLAKDPERRYGTADELGRDLERYLLGLPIDARRDRTGYVLRKTLWRYRTVAGATAIVLLAMVIGLVVSLRFAWQSQQARLAAEDANRAAQAAKDDAITQQQQAERQAYAANVAAALLAVRQHDAVDARYRLSLAPEHLRQLEWQIAYQQVDTSRRQMTGHQAYVEAVQFVQQGDRILSTSWDRTARLTDTKSGELIRTLEAPAALWCLAVAPDSHTVALGCFNGTVLLWDSATGRTIRTLSCPFPQVRSVAISADGQTLAAISHRAKSGSVIQVWHLPDGTLQHTLERRELIGKLAFHPERPWLIAGSFAGPLMFDLTTGTPRKEWVVPELPCSAIAVSPNGQWLAVALGDFRIALLDAKTGTTKGTLRGHRQDVLDLTFLPDGLHLASASRDRTVRLWNITHGREVDVRCGHTWTVTSVAAHPQGTSLVSASWDQTVRLWDTKRATIPARHTDRIFGLATHPKLAIYATASKDGTLSVWDELAQLRWHAKHHGPVQAVAFDPTGVRLASASWDKTVGVWSVATGQRLHELIGHTDHVHAVAFNHDGSVLATGSRDNTIRLWDLHTGKLQAVLTGHTDHIHSLAFSAEYLASAGHETIRLWRIATWTLERQLARKMVYEDFSLAFHPNGRYLAAGSDIQVVSVWDVTTGERCAELRGHADEIHMLAFNPQGTRLATAATDRTLRLWETTAWTEVARFADTMPRIDAMAFDRTGQRLLLGFPDGSLRLLPDGR